MGVDQNEHLSLSPKTSSKILMFRNYLAICHCFKLDFLNRVIGKKNFFKKNYMKLELYVTFCK